MEGTADDERFMRQAIELSRRAVEHGNEPFGAVLVRDDEVVFTNENHIYTSHNHTEHAEMGLINRFCEQTHIADLSDYTLYSSSEPCFMCSGALVWAKLGRLVYGASDVDLGLVLGADGCACSRIVFENFGRGPVVRAGVLRDEAIAVLRDYFAVNDKN